MPKGQAGPHPEERRNGKESPSETKAVPELFSGPPTIKRSLSVPLTPEDIAIIHAEMAKVAIQFVEQQERAAYAKECAKGLQAQQAELVLKLRVPMKMVEVDCCWKLRLDENAKDLIRLDTQEVIETRPLSEEDRAAELARVQEQNTKTKAASAYRRDRDSLGPMTNHSDKV